MFGFQIDLLMSTPRAKKEVPEEAELDAQPPTESVIDHLCGNLEPTDAGDELLEVDDDEPDVNVFRSSQAFVPDLTLRYPPTFSESVSAVSRGLLFLLQ